MTLNDNDTGDTIARAIKQVDSSTWILGPLVLRRSATSSASSTWNDPHDGSSYTITAPLPMLEAPTTEMDSPHMRLIHEVGEESAVWAIGSNVVCKVRYIFQGATSEASTLKAIKARQFSFDIPNVLYEAYGKGRSYLFIQRLPGITLQAAWPKLNDLWRAHYMDTAVKAYSEMATWTRSMLGGVDGAGIADRFLIKPGDADEFSPARLLAACEELGMDTKTFVFNHADMGPTNIMVEEEPATGKIGIIDWEIAGFYPILWVRTKVRISGGLNMETADDPLIWRKEVQKALAAQGFEDVVPAWNDRRSK